MSPKAKKATARSLNGIGARIRKLRGDQELDQGELASRSRISQGYLSQIETGYHENPTFAILESVAHGLGLSIWELTQDAPPERSVWLPSLEAEISRLTLEQQRRLARFLAGFSAKATA